MGAHITSRERLRKISSLSSRDSPSADIGYGSRVGAGLVEIWVQGWNAHDLDQVLSHFADDVVFTSPVAEQLLANSVGVIRGKIALAPTGGRAYRRIPDLRFEVLGVYLGLHTLVISYRNQKGGW